MGIFHELRRRKVTRVAAVYGVTVWLLLQIVDVVGEPLLLPEWFATVVVALMAIGFPLALVLAWAFEVTPDGVRRASSRDGAIAIPPGQSRIDYVIAGLLVIAIGWMVYTGSRQTEVEPTATEEAAETTSVAIAVLPFVNMSNDPEQEFFSDGISEDLLNELARSTNLTVRPRSSSFQFKASNEDSQSIGRQLDVTHIVEGSVRTSGDQVRVSVHLTDVSDNRSIWSQRYERELVDVFKVQDEITREILEALDVHLSSRGTLRKFASRESYDAFLRGRYALSQYDFANAERWLGTAVALDPQNADAWALRADNNAYQSAVELRPNGGNHLKLRREYIKKALSIDPKNPTALRIHALMDTHYLNLDYQAAVNELVRLASLHPNDQDILIDLSFVLATIGRADLVDRVTAQVVRLAPLSGNAWAVRIYFGFIMFGRVDEAREAIDEHPSPEPAVSAILALAERDTVALQAIAPRIQRGSGAATVFAALVPYLEGDFERAREIVAPLKHAEGYQAFRIKAFVAMVERDLQSAFANYRKAIHAGEQSAIVSVHAGAGWRQAFPEFYADPRYTQMLVDFRLDPASTAKINVPDLPF